MADRNSPRVTVARKPWHDMAVPAPLDRMRSMLSHEEKQYLIWLTATQFENWGAVIDLGAWLGSSTAAMAEGMNVAGRGGHVDSFDRWEWDPDYMEAFADEHLARGDDFMPLFLRELGSYADRVTPHRQDLTTYAWEGGPIEILFVDAAKTWDLTNAIFRGFAASIVPLRTRVVLQDFRYHETHWLPLIFDSRPDLWREVETVDDGCTVTFMALRPLNGPGGLDPAYSEDTFSLASARTILEARIARESAPNWHYLIRTLYRLVLADGSREEAAVLRRRILAAGIRTEELAAIENIAPLLVPLGWKAFVAHDFKRARSIAERCLLETTEPSAYALCLLGMSMLQLGMVDAARGHIDDAIRRKPDYLDARLHRAEIALAQRRPRDAATDATFVLDQPDIPAPTAVYASAILRKATLQGLR